MDHHTTPHILPREANKQANIFITHKMDYIDFDPLSECLRDQLSLTVDWQRRGSRKNCRTNVYPLWHFESVKTDLVNAFDIFMLCTFTFSFSLSVSLSLSLYMSFNFLASLKIYIPFYFPPSFSLSIFLFIFIQNYQQ